VLVESPEKTKYVRRLRRNFFLNFHPISLKLISKRDLSNLEDLRALMRPERVFLLMCSSSRSFRDSR
jgi:hypothetical protein